MPANGITIPALARAIDENTGCGVARAETVLRALVDQIDHHVRERGERVYISGLGTFFRAEWKGRTLPKVKTHDAKFLPSRHRVDFRPASCLRGLEIRETKKRGEAA